MRFASKRALVTGATGAIGSVIAAKLADEGATVDVVSRQTPKSSRYRWHTADFSEGSDFETVASAIASNFDQLDILIHSAGHYSIGHLRDTSVDELDLLWRTNVRASWGLTRALLPALQAARGTVVFVNSSIWLRSTAGLGGYAATKFASKAIADALREEVAPDGIRVQSVFPGSTAGAIQERRATECGHAYDPTRLIQPEEVATAVLDNMAYERLDEIVISRKGSDEA